jgi:hypothetical protein
MCVTVADSHHSGPSKVAACGKAPRAVYDTPGTYLHAVLFDEGEQSRGCTLLHVGQRNPPGLPGDDAVGEQRRIDNTSSGLGATGRLSLAHSMADKNIGAKADRTRALRHLRELIAALDRRVPHIERSGEIAIARDAAKLKKKALHRIARLEAASGDR